MPWIKRILRGTEVFARARDDGALDVGADGRVDVKYQLGDGAKVYRAAARNLEASTDASPVTPSPPKSGTPTRGTLPPAAPLRAAHGETIVIYTDGACAGNPGPMGIGVVIIAGKDRREIGEYLGIGTNNIAELTAIERALDGVLPEERSQLVLVHADSSYALGVVSGTMKAKKNVDLVARIRLKARGFSRLEYVKVRGHAGVVENERCDELATGAIEAARRAGRV